MPRFALRLFLSAAFSASQLTGQADCGRLDLVEQSRIPLPPGAGVSGAVGGPDHSLLFWTAAPSILIVSRGQVREVPVPPGTWVSGLAAVPGTGVFRVFDGGARAELWLDPSGRLLGRSALNLPDGEVVEQAILVGGDWVVGSRDLSSRRFVVRRYIGGTSRLLFTSAPADSVPAIPTYRLTPDGDGILAAARLAPFELVRLDGRGGHSMLGPPLSRSISIPDDSLRYWRSLGALPLDCGVLVTLADLTSERRLLVRYAPGGTVAAVTELAAPIGLVMSWPRSRRLVAARRAGALELVAYDWRWARPDSTTALSTNQESFR